MFRTVASDVTLSEVERLDAIDQADVTFEMDEDAFRAFYERTSRSLWNYLARLTGDRQVADDLLQESFYRFLRSRGSWETEAHRRAYLFRIATNLVRDSQRRARRGQTVALPDPDHSLMSAGGDVAESTAARTDLHRAMRRLRPRERALLWLAYGQGHAHTEIALTLGVKTASVKLLLFRAKRRLATLLTRTPESGAGRERREIR
jgi:RNA polymerase sigma-70 factor (ECF subfamily)